MQSFFLILYALLFAYLARKNFRLAVGIFIIALPAYLIRFNFGPLPSTLLELNFVILFLVWLVKYRRTDLPAIIKLFRNYPYFSIFLVLFFSASISGIFISDMRWYSLGQWRAYFLEPMLIFAMLAGRMSSANTTETQPRQLRPTSELTSGDLIFFLILSAISVSFVAFSQKFTGQLFPPSLWNDALRGRVTSFFTSPNAVGLCLGPLMPLILGGIFSIKNNRKFFESRNYRQIILILVLLISGAALFFSQSLGAIAGVMIGLLLFAFLIGYKKTALAAVVIGSVIAIFLLPRLAVFKHQSFSNRLALWRHTAAYLSVSPKNFIFGAGIRQYFRKVEKPVFNPKELERLIYPHNIFLNFWTEIGLVGLFSFIGIFYFLILFSYRVYKKNAVWGATLISALAVMIIHGLVDVPYFKNDLAMMFWIIAAAVTSHEVVIIKSGLKP